MTAPLADHGQEHRQQSCEGRWHRSPSPRSRRTGYHARQSSRHRRSSRCLAWCSSCLGLGDAMIAVGGSAILAAAVVVDPIGHFVYLSSAPCAAGHGVVVAHVHKRIRFLYVLQPRAKEMQKSPTAAGSVCNLHEKY